MSKGFDDILKERIQELPSHVPDEALWRAVQTDLNTEDAVIRHLTDLPMHAPAPGTWETIEASLPAGDVAGSVYSNGADTRREAGTSDRSLNKPLRRLLWLTTAAAAAVILLLSLPPLIRSGQDIIIESEALMSEEPGTVLTRNGEVEDPMEIIRDLCKTGAPVCQSELFREKMQFYRELSEELMKLEEVIDHVGESPEIIQSVIRIENLKSGTLQELIQLIHS